MILLVGAGPMAQDHAKVLASLDQDFTVVGRGIDSARQFEEVTGHAVVPGGLEAHLKGDESIPVVAIVSVGVEQLATSTLALMENGVQRILVEKPAGLTRDEIEEVSDVARQKEVEVYVAYNRRFFASVLAAQAIIEEDGGVDSYNFEITEWGHVIAPLEKEEGVKDNWFLGNTSHVADLAFYLGGEPEEIQCFTSGGTDWHTRSSNFSGAGRTENGALFCYHGNWNAPGRWSVEMLTRRHRLIFRPLEKLQVQKLGSVAVEEAEIDDSLDTEFKPGLYGQLRAFLHGPTDALCNIDQHRRNCLHYSKMANYK